tara:strand:- start:892 stop:1575 length:684 start_codon:yes stop_codon:yes gene_type:complete
MATSAYRGLPNNKKTSFNNPPKPQMTGKRTSLRSVEKGRLGGPRNSLKEIRKKPTLKAAPVKKTPMKKSKYAHNLKQVGMPQDGGFTNQDYTSKGLRTLLSQGNPNNKLGEYQDGNKGLNDRTTSVVEGYEDKPLKITINTGPLNQNPGALMGNKNTGPRRKKVGKGSYQRGTTAPKTKMVLAPHRNPMNKKVRVIDRPVTRKKPKNNTGSARFAGGGLVASLYESF